MPRFTCETQNNFMLVAAEVTENTTVCMKYFHFIQILFIVCYFYALRKTWKLFDLVFLNEMQHLQEIIWSCNNLLLWEVFKLFYRFYWWFQQTRSKQVKTDLAAVSSRLVFLICWWKRKLRSQPDMISSEKLDWISSSCGATAVTEQIKWF